MPPQSFWPDAPGSIAVVMEDGGVVLHLRGEVDMATVAAFEADSEHDPAMVGQLAAVDVSEVTFFSSTGVGCLLRMTRDVRETGRRPLVRGATRPVLRVLELTGLADVFDVQPRPEA